MSDRTEAQIMAGCYRTGGTRATRKVTPHRWTICNGWKFCGYCGTVYAPADKRKRAPMAEAYRLLNPPPPVSSETLKEGR